MNTSLPTAAALPVLPALSPRVVRNLPRAFSAAFETPERGKEEGASLGELLSVLKELHLALSH
ncbi:hypothetical protein SAMN05444156_0572 [Verrucomicrobium sp. GAS474]|uniref:hypothetical protein n=1 Tax=Verrucomicrobium sp. GAS474 TaxID=1882831 RepID=UPI00087C1927|nr:hypothetical protein [Verrucomicrobium sp. GAS474]SDT90109.1 hypothetical protein SAMN05444156_0572 [Verrucomicrobium sp. GAS474]